MRSRNRHTGTMSKVKKHRGSGRLRPRPVPRGTIAAHSVNRIIRATNLKEIPTDAVNRLTLLLKIMLQTHEIFKRNSKIASDSVVARKLTSLKRGLSAVSLALENADDNVVTELLYAAGNHYGRERLKKSFLPSDIHNLQRNANLAANTVDHFFRTQKAFRKLTSLDQEVWPSRGSARDQHVRRLIHPYLIKGRSQYQFHDLLGGLAQMYVRVFQKEFRHSKNASKNGIRFDGPGIQFAKAVIEEFDLIKDFDLNSGVRLENKIGETWRRFSAREKRLINAHVDKL